jgi:DNA-binding NarL/FixJ family response regulator
MKSVTVLLGDDQPIFLAGIRGILSLNPSLEIVGEVHTAERLSALVKEYLPDLVISDASLPGADLSTTIRMLKQETLTVKFLLIAEEATEEPLFKFLEVGIDGYALKDDPPEILVQAVLAVIQGGMWISPMLIRHLITAAIPPCHSSCRQSSTLGMLSKREQEILRLLAMGMENCEIADTLCITKRTVQNHVSTVYQKLCVKGRSQAVLYAIKAGLVRY